MKKEENGMKNRLKKFIIIISIIFTMMLLYFLSGKYIFSKYVNANTPCFITYFILPFICNLFILLFIGLILGMIELFLCIRNWLYEGKFIAMIGKYTLNDYIYKFFEGSFQ